MSKIIDLSGDTIKLTPNSTGNVQLGTLVIDADQTVGAGQDNYVLTYDNGTGLISLEAAGGGGATGYLYSGTISVSPSGSGEDTVVIGDNAAGGSATQGVCIGVDSTLTNASSGQVAIGYGAVINTTTQSAVAIGKNAKATGNYSVAINTDYNLAGEGATGSGSIAIGYRSKATSSSSIALGYNSQSTEPKGVAIGETSVVGFEGVSIGANSNASGGYHQGTAIGANAVTTANIEAVAIGANADARGTGAISIGRAASSYNNSYGICIGRGATNYTGSSSPGAQAIGPYTKAFNPSECAYGSGYYTTQGDCQTLHYYLRAQTTDASSVEMLASPTSGAGTQRAVLPNDSTVLFTAKVVARRTDVDGSNGAKIIHGIIKRDTNAASTAIVDSTTQYNGGINYTITATADTTNGALKITVTGVAANTILWFCDLEMQRVFG